MRKAGELIAQYLREGKLAANRSKPIGAGGNAVVYASDVPGNVMKQGHVADESFPGRSLTDEANLQAIAAEMGIAPRVAGLETFPGGIGNRIEMADVRDNFETHGKRAREFPTGRDAVRVNQQLGALALKGVDLDDRHTGNIMYNKMTGRPLQIDFGKSRNVTGEDQIAALTNATEAGLTAAGLGDVADAMDVAKQGFSRLQKIK